MVEGKKIVGGALRLTRTGILYQGNIQLENLDKPKLKGRLKTLFSDSLLSHSDR